MAALDPKKLKVNELRKELEDRGIDAKGLLKADLIAKLEEVLAAEAPAAASKAPASAPAPAVAPAAPLAKAPGTPAAPASAASGSVAPAGASAAAAAKPAAPQPAQPASTAADGDGGGVLTAEEAQMVSCLPEAKRAEIIARKKRCARFGTAFELTDAEKKLIRQLKFKEGAAAAASASSSSSSGPAASSSGRADAAPNPKRPRVDDPEKLAQRKEKFKKEFEELGSAGLLSAKPQRPAKPAAAPASGPASGPAPKPAAAPRAPAAASFSEEDEERRRLRLERFKNM